MRKSPKSEEQKIIKKNTHQTGVRGPCSVVKTAKHQMVCSEASHCMLQSRCLPQNFHEMQSCACSSKGKYCLLCTVELQNLRMQYNWQPHLFSNEGMTCAHAAHGMC